MGIKVYEPTKNRLISETYDRYHLQGIFKLKCCKFKEYMQKASFFTFASQALIGLALIALTGCSTISGSGSNQAISVQTISPDGSSLDGAKCDMTNDEGTWFVVTPGSTMVHRSNKDLQVICRKTGSDVGSALVVSRTKGNMYGNIVFGGGIGAIIDHNNGAAYEYPGLIQVFMGRSNQKIDEKSSQAAFETNSTTVPTIMQSSVTPINTNALNLEAYERKCSELGFKKGTEAFGNCVLKLAK